MSSTVYLGVCFFLFAVYRTGDRGRKYLLIPPNQVELVHPYTPPSPLSHSSKPLVRYTRAGAVLIPSRKTPRMTASETTTSLSALLLNHSGCAPPRSVTTVSKRISRLQEEGVLLMGGEDDSWGREGKKRHILGWDGYPLSLPSS